MNSLETPEERKGLPDFPSIRKPGPASRKISPASRKTSPTTRKSNPARMGSCQGGADRTLPWQLQERAAWKLKDQARAARRREDQAEGQ